MSETLAGVLKEEPRWSAFPHDVGPGVRRLLRRCLRKDPRDRIPDAAMARIEIDDAHRRDLAESATTEPRAWKSRRTWIFSSTVLAAALVGATFAWRLGLGSSGTAAGVTRFAIALPATTSLNLGAAQPVAITRDGRQLVYSAIGQIYARAFDDLESVPIPGAQGEGLGSIFLSADSEWIGYVDSASPSATFKKIRFDGGQPITICSIPYLTSFRGASWGSTGVIVFASGGFPGLMKVSDGGGTPERLTNPTGESHGSPSFLPDGKTLLFEVRAPDKPPSIAVLSIDTGEHKTLIDGSWPHVAGGHLVFHRNGVLWAAAFDQTRLQLTGTAMPLLQDVAPSFDIAPNGTLVYSRGTDAAVTQRALVWVDRTGREELVPAPVRGFLYPSLSPDGTRVAIDVRDDSAGDIWIWDFERRTLEKRTFDTRLDSYPLWTPNGRHLVFASVRTGIPNIYRLSSDGTGHVQRLTESPNRHEPLSFAPDGTRLIFREVKASTGVDLSMLSTEGRITPVLASQFSESNAAISPDGRWLAYESTDTGQTEIYVRPFPEVNSGKWLVSTSGGTRPVWARSGREIFYMTSNLAGPVGIMAVPVEEGTTFRWGPPQKLFEGNYRVPAAGNIGRNYDVSPDGKRFLMTKTDRRASDVANREIIVVLNWLEELKRRVPNRE